MCLKTWCLKHANTHSLEGDSAHLQTDSCKVAVAYCNGALGIFDTETAVAAVIASTAQVGLPACMRASRPRHFTNKCDACMCRIPGFSMVLWRACEVLVAGERQALAHLFVMAACCSSAVIQQQ
jgi:hypothetical protein